MFKYALSIIIIFAAGFKLSASFVNPLEAVTLFGAEVNIWIYRLVWLAAGALSVFAIYRTRKKISEKQ
ncbi:hypothetical protein ACFQO1_10155 [Jejudonia soesokkakensis]|uniref:Uncharacterized protein n=1 Tax=Jejudonia soesokkakensis TaxID=1323432 RepID=A0ABW2MWZ6_9FLAO